MHQADLADSFQLHERLQRDGIKSHKERVEELNTYLSRLSEHHDMYVWPWVLQVLVGYFLCWI